MKAVGIYAPLEIRPDNDGVILSGKKVRLNKNRESESAVLYGYTLSSFDGFMAF